MASHLVAITPCTTTPCCPATPKPCSSPLGAAAASCNDWFFGIGGSTPANQQYLAALATYNIGATPSVSCRMEANTVHSMELVTAEPGANALFDDARKVGIEGNSFFCWAHLSASQNA